MYGRRIFCRSVKKSENAGKTKTKQVTFHQGVPFTGFVLQNTMKDITLLILEVASNNCRYKLAKEYLLSLGTVLFQHSQLQRRSS